MEDQNALVLYYQFLNQRKAALEHIRQTDREATLQREEFDYRKKQYADQEAEHQRQASNADIQSRMQMSQYARPVKDGMVEQVSPLNTRMAGLPEGLQPESPTVNFSRPVDPSRAVGYKSANGQESSYELRTPDDLRTEQDQHQRAIRSDEAKAAIDRIRNEGLTKLQIEQMNREENGIAMPADFAIPDARGRKFLPGEMRGVMSAVPKPEKPPEQKMHFETGPDGRVRAIPYGPDGKIGTTSDLGQIGKPERPRAAAGGGGATSDTEMIAQAIIDGKQPPDMKGLYSKQAPIRAFLAKQGYDLTAAQRDWSATQRHMATLNGPQQEKLRQAITFTSDSLDNIEQLYSDWKKDGLMSSRFKILNRGALAAAKQIGGKSGEIATNLDAQINDLVSELGTVYKGGNSSTDHSLKMAAENLKGEWDEGTFKKAVGQIRQNLSIRRNSIMTSGPAGVSDNSPYTPTAQRGGAAAPAAATVKLRAPDGSIREVSADQVDHYLQLGAKKVQ